MTKSAKGYMLDEEDMRSQLQVIEMDPNYICKPGHTANVINWPDGKMPFIEVHIAYLKAHPQIKPEHYISNLKLMTKKRG